jgi:hypothetical protein
MVAQRSGVAAAWVLGIALATFVLLTLAAPVVQPQAGTVPPAKTAAGATPFDHAKTGYILRDVHTTLRCEQCHVDGIFKNTPRECAGCHAVGTRVGATPRPINHVQTTLPCDQCHVSQTSFLVKSFKHVGVINNCNTCHNQQSLGVKSKPANHFPTLMPCENCHTNTTTFTSWTMDHTGITSGCTSCHSGQFPGVVSKPAMHIPVAPGQDCSGCHVGTSTFLGALYAHGAVAAGSCDACHNGSYPGVKTYSPGHIPRPPGTFCDTCHTQANTGGYSTFLGASFHGAYPAPAGGCIACHNGAYLAANAQAKPATHIPATASCDVCHTNGNFASFAAGGFHTIGANNAAITAGPCSICHNGSYVGWVSSNGLSPRAKIVTHIPTTADCYSCHTATNTGNYTTFLGAGFHGVAANNVGIAGTCGRAGCHDTVGGINAAGAQGHPLSAVHTGVGINCDQCHTPSITLNYTTFLGATYTHNNPPGVCANCHNGVSATGKPAAHIPTTALCDQCHGLPPPLGTAVTFAGATFHAVAANNATAVGLCQNCHNGSYTSLVSGNGLVPQPRSVPHIPTTGSCDQCHTATNTANYNNFRGAAYNHAGVAAGGCVTCHNGSYPGVDYQSFCYGTGGTGAGCPVPGAFAHQVTAAPCDQCHNSGASLNYTTWANAGYTHTAADAGRCANAGCHAPGGAGKGVSTNHAPVIGLSCDAGGCHTSPGVSFAGGQLVHSVVTITRCDACHNGAYTAFGLTGAMAKVTNHVPTTITGALDCNTCHRGTNPQNAAAAAGGLTLFAKGAQPGETMNHNGAQGMGAPIYCVNCHLSGVTYLGTMQKKSHNGASSAKDCSSSSCHRPLGRIGTAYSSWN